MADSAAAPHAAPHAGGAEVTKRDFLKLVAGAGAAVGTGAIVWPMVDSMNPVAVAFGVSSRTEPAGAVLPLKTAVAAA